MAEVAAEARRRGLAPGPTAGFAAAVLRREQPRPTGPGGDEALVVALSASGTGEADPDDGVAIAERWLGAHAAPVADATAVRRRLEGDPAADLGALAVAVRAVRRAVL